MLWNLENFIIIKFFFNLDFLWLIILSLILLNSVRFLYWITSNNIVFYFLWFINFIIVLLRLFHCYSIENYFMAFLFFVYLIIFITYSVYFVFSLRNYEDSYLYRILKNRYSSFYIIEGDTIIIEKPFWGLIFKAILDNYSNAFASAFNNRSDFLRRFFLTVYIYPYGYILLFSIISLTALLQRYYHCYFYSMHYIILFLFIWFLVDLFFTHKRLNFYLSDFYKSNNDLYFSLVKDFILLKGNGFGTDSGGSGGFDKPEGSHKPESSKIKGLVKKVVESPALRNQIRDVVTKEVSETGIKYLPLIVAGGFAVEVVSVIDTMITNHDQRKTNEVERKYYLENLPNSSPTPNSSPASTNKDSI